MGLFVSRAHDPALDRPVAIKMMSPVAVSIPALTAKLSKIANSAHFNRGGSKVADARRAAAVLGLDHLKRAFDLGEAEGIEAIREAHRRVVDFATGVGVPLRDFTPPSRPRPFLEDVPPTLQDGLVDAL